jgi:hypothetical protein
MSNPRPRKRAKALQEGIQRAEYKTSQRSRQGVRILERSKPVIHTNIPQASQQAEERNSEEEDNTVVPTGGTCDESHDLIPTLDEIQTSWGKVRNCDFHLFLQS